MVLLRTLTDSSLVKQRVNNNPVTGLTVSPKTTTIAVGATKQASVTVVPDNATDKTVTWSSADNTIATVDNNGLITGVKEGTVSLSVTSSDGKVVSTIAVTVSPAS